MPVAAIVKVLPAPTVWASSVLPELMPRQTASSWWGRRSYGRVHPRKIEVRAVEQAGTQVVVSVVVGPHQSFGAVGIGEHPRAEAFLDEFLFFAGGERRFLVDDALLAVAIHHRVVNRRRLHVQRQFEEPGAVGTRRPEFRRGSHGGGRGVAGVEAPDGVFLQVADGHGWKDRHGIARRRTPGCRFRVSTGLRDWRRCRPAARPRAGLNAKPRHCVHSQSPACFSGCELLPDVSREIDIGRLPGFRLRVVENQVAEFLDDRGPRACDRARRCRAGPRCLSG